jgi:hypothetical protein
MDIPDDTNPFDQEDIELLCVHYTNLSMEAYNERRMISWADMMQEEEDEMSSAIEYWDGDHPSLITLEPTKYISSPLSFCLDFDEDVEIADSELITQDDDEELCKESYNEDAINRHDWEDHAPEQKPKEMVSKISQQIRLSQVFMKPVGKYTSLRDLVLLRAASKAQDLSAALGWESGEVWLLVASWDYWISSHIENTLSQDIWELSCSK